MEFSVTSKITGFPFINKSEYGKLSKHILQDLISWWHRRMFPGHFERSAHAKYGYQSRDRKYVMKKLKRFKQAIDLIKTGEMQRDLTTMIRISGTAKKGRGTMTGPRYLSMIRRDPTRPHLAAELLAVTKAEEMKLAKRYEEDMAYALNNLRSSKTTRL